MRRGWISGCAVVLAFSACTQSAPVAAEIDPPAAVEPTIIAEPAPTAPPVGTTCRGDTARLTAGRTDVRPSGNRVAPGAIDLLNAPMSSTELPAPAAWIVPFFSDDEPCQPYWYIALEDGQAVTVDADGNITEAGAAIVPPESRASGIVSAYENLGQFDDALPDSRVVSFGQWTAALVDPTDRYGHGVLGDRIEAGAVEVIDTESGERTRIVVDAPSVIEGISPMLLDVDPPDTGEAQEGVPEVLVTVSNSDDGAWLALYDINGTLRARSEPIGRGNRWRNQLGASWLGSDYGLEIIDVRTPHLDGVVEFFRVNGDRLERVASITGYTSHVLGSRNLDMGILVDADEDKVVEVVLPTRDLRSLAVLDRDGDRAVELGRIDLEGSLNTNIASQWLVGQAWLAVGTSDGRLLVFGDLS